MKRGLNSGPNISWSMAIFLAIAAGPMPGMNRNKNPNHWCKRGPARVNPIHPMVATRFHCTVSRSSMNFWQSKSPEPTTNIDVMDFVMIGWDSKYALYEKPPDRLLLRPEECWRDPPEFDEELLKRRCAVPAIVLARVRRRVAAENVRPVFGLTRPRDSERTPSEAGAFIINKRNAMVPSVEKQSKYACQAHLE